MSRSLFIMHLLIYLFVFILPNNIVTISSQGEILICGLSIISLFHKSIAELGFTAKN
ncbi:hypothetical protein SLEP1_g25208 [Rubroshorea leprosula]|uniref:Uncharacterized protein n=1 Tax=Rubroshorea leprosula TaxID=152421 RepID=A0AAV5JSM5_9ROSI|nr:hypothetical protein SLEP1_g25208 [Rubroshorea leprosula]